MNTESPRLRALLAAGAALVVFGITIPATASPDAPNENRPGVGEVGKAEENANPKKQTLGEGEDGNNGFRCDNNGGAGVGNPALGACGDSTDNVHPGNGGNPGDGGPGNGGGYTDTGDGGTDGEWSSPS